MSKANEPAFPLMSVEHGPILGLTKREYFAAMAMQGICAGFKEPADAAVSAPGVAEDAIKLADALIAELEKQP